LATGSLHLSRLRERSLRSQSAAGEGSLLWGIASRRHPHPGPPPQAGEGVHLLRGNKPNYHAALVVTSVAIGNPCSIGSDGSRDHSFQEPKYIRTSFTPAFFSARNVFEARAPLKQ